MGPGSILGWKFLFFNKKDSLYQLKNFLSVLKMASLVYERENCVPESPIVPQNCIPQNGTPICYRILTYVVEDLSLALVYFTRFPEILQSETLSTAQAVHTTVTPMAKHTVQWKKPRRSCWGAREQDQMRSLSIGTQRLLEYRSALHNTFLTRSLVAMADGLLRPSIVNEDAAHANLRQQQAHCYNKRCDKPCDVPQPQAAETKAQELLSKTASEPNPPTTVKVQPQATPVKAPELRRPRRIRQVPGRC